MKWNGRNYRPAYGIPVYPKKESSIEELLKPLGEKIDKGNVWRPILNQPVNIYKEPVTTPQVTPSPTPSPSVTPTQTPTPSGTGTPTPTPTSTSTPTPSPSTPAAASISYRQVVEGTDEIVNCNFGTPGLIVVMVQGENNNSGTIDNVTIGGVVATQAILNSYNFGGSNRLVHGIYYRVVTGSTGTVKVNFTTANNAYGLSVFTITNYNSSTPTYTFGVGSAATTSLSETTTSLSAGSVGVTGLMNSIASGKNITWTNATERFDIGYSTVSQGSGADFTQATTGTRTITVSGLANSGSNVWQIATWR
jgi:hypothetical protein